MGKISKIAWTDATFNPWIGCTKVSPGCEHCYAEAQDKRWGNKRWGPKAPRTRTSESYWKQPLAWNKEAAKSVRPFRVFCASLADVCEDRDDLLPIRADLMRLIESTPALTWLLLTKRPENFNRFFGGRWTNFWPRNVWAMTTAENQEQADKRVPFLLEVPAVVRGVSYEPAIGPVDLSHFLTGNCSSCGKPTPKKGPAAGECSPCEYGTFGGGVDWVIAGGESGAAARPFETRWAREVRDQCRDAGVAFFMKQLGSLPRFDRDETTRLNLSKKGDEPSEWTSDLRVQEFPAVAAPSPEKERNTA